MNDEASTNDLAFRADVFTHGAGFCSIYPSHFENALAFAPPLRRNFGTLAIAGIASHFQMIAETESKRERDIARDLTAKKIGTLLPFCANYQKGHWKQVKNGIITHTDSIGMAHKLQSQARGQVALVFGQHDLVSQPCEAELERAKDLNVTVLIDETAKHDDLMIDPHKVLYQWLGRGFLREYYQPVAA